jgi:single-stranded DNA-binding protein
MAKGQNVVILTGDVGNVVHTSTYVKNDPVITFMLCIEEKENYPVWVKVSAYGNQAQYLKKLNLDKGDNLSFLGKLVNKTSKRNNREFVEIEVKLLDQVILRKRNNKEQHSGNEGD